MDPPPSLATIKLLLSNSCRPFPLPPIIIPIILSDAKDKINMVAVKMIIRWLKCHRLLLLSLEDRNHAKVSANFMPELTEDNVPFVNFIR